MPEALRCSVWRPVLYVFPCGGGNILDDPRTDLPRDPVEAFIHSLPLAPHGLCPLGRSRPTITEASNCIIPQKARAKGGGTTLALYIGKGRMITRNCLDPNMIISGMVVIWML